MTNLTFRRVLLMAAFLVMAGVIVHQRLQITGLQADLRDVHASRARLLLRPGPALPVRLTDEEFRLVLKSLETREGADLLKESSVSRSSFWPVNTTVLKSVE